MPSVVNPDKLTRSVSVTLARHFNPGSCDKLKARRVSDD